MSYTADITFLSEPRILIVRTVGTLPISAWPDVIRQAVEEARKHACLRYLVDHRDARFQYRFADLWMMPRNAGSFHTPPNARCAVLMPNPHSVRKTFIEAFMHNRGFQLKLFERRELAISWLLESSSDAF
jgi:hypothetical protein